MTSATKGNAVVPFPSGRRLQLKRVSFSVLVKRAINYYKFKSGSSRKAILKYVYSITLYTKTKCKRECGRAIKRMLKNGYIRKIGRSRLVLTPRGKLPNFGKKKPIPKHERQWRNSRRKRRRKGRKNKRRTKMRAARSRSSRKVSKKKASKSSKKGGAPAGIDEPMAIMRPDATDEILEDPTLNKPDELIQKEIGDKNLFAEPTHPMDTAPTNDEAGLFSNLFPITEPPDAVVEKIESASTAQTQESPPPDVTSLENTEDLNTSSKSKSKRSKKSQSSSSKGRRSSLRSQESGSKLEKRRSSLKSQDSGSNGGSRRSSLKLQGSRSRLDKRKGSQKSEKRRSSKASDVVSDVGSTEVEVGSDQNPDKERCMEQTDDEAASNVSENEGIDGNLIPSKLDFDATKNFSKSDITVPADSLTKVEKRLSDVSMVESPKDSKIKLGRRRSSSKKIKSQLKRRTSNTKPVKSTDSKISRRKSVKTMVKEYEEKIEKLAGVQEIQPVNETNDLTSPENPQNQEKENNDTENSMKDVSDVDSTKTDASDINVKTDVNDIVNTKMSQLMDTSAGENISEINEKSVPPFISPETMEMDPEPENPLDLLSQENVNQLETMGSG